MSFGALILTRAISVLDGMEGFYFWQRQLPELHAIILSKIYGRLPASPRDYQWPN